MAVFYADMAVLGAQIFRLDIDSRLRHGSEDIVDDGVADRATVHRGQRDTVAPAFVDAAVLDGDIVAPPSQSVLVIGI